MHMCMCVPSNQYHDMYNVKSNYFFLCGYASFSFILWAHISRYFIWLNSFRSINFVCMYMSVFVPWVFHSIFMWMWMCMRAYSMCDAREIVNMFWGRFASYSHIYKLLKNLWSHPRRKKLCWREKQALRTRCGANIHREEAGPTAIWLARRREKERER